MSDTTPGRIVSEIDAIKVPKNRTFLELQSPLQFKTLAHLWALLSPISAEIAELLAFSEATPDLAGRITTLEANVAKAMDVRLTVPDAAARLTLTAADVQNGDFVAQTSPALLFEVVDATQLGTENAFKSWSTGDIEVQSYTLTNGQTQPITLTKMITFINVTPPATGLATIDLGTSGLDGAVVIVKRLGASAAGAIYTSSLVVRSRTGLGANTNAVVLSSANYTPSHAIISRVAGTPASNGVYHSVILRTNASGQVTNISGTAISAVSLLPSRLVTVVKGLESARFTVSVSDGGSLPVDGDTIWVQAYTDGGATLVWQGVYEFDDNGMLNDGSATSVAIASGDFESTLNNLAAAIGATPGFVGSYAVTHESGNFVATFTLDPIVNFVSPSASGVASVAAVAYNPATPGGSIGVVGGDLSSILVQHGPLGGVNVDIDIYVVRAGVDYFVARIPASGPADVVLSLKDILLSRGLEWIVFAMNTGSFVRLEQSVEASNANSSTTIIIETLNLASLTSSLNG